MTPISNIVQAMWMASLAGSVPSSLTVTAFIAEPPRERGGRARSACSGHGRTTDTAHLIVATHANREGSYVALARAREHTHIYAADAPDPTPDRDRLQELAERVSRTEPDLPSIHTPLAHESTILENMERSRIDNQPERLEPDIAADQTAELPPEELDRGAELRSSAAPNLDLERRREERRDIDELALAIDDEDLSLTANQDGDKVIEQTPARTWPRRPDRPLSPDRLERDGTVGWEP